MTRVRWAVLIGAIVLVVVAAAAYYVFPVVVYVELIRALGGSK